MPRPGHLNVGGLASGPDNNPSQAPGSGAAATNVIEMLRSAVGGPYHHWPSPYPDFRTWGPEHVKRHGLSCSEYLDWGFIKCGFDVGHRGSYGWCDQSWMKPIEKGKTYAVGTIIGSKLGPEGHVCIVSGPGNRVLSADTAAGINEKWTIGDMYSWQEKPQFAGVMPNIGTTTPTAGQSVDQFGNAIEHLLENLASQIGKGLVMGLKYLYAYTILRPWDFWSGFSYELVIAVKDDFSTDEQDELRKGNSQPHKETGNFKIDPNQFGGGNF